jgi:hypothetical protein
MAAKRLQNLRIRSFTTDSAGFWRNSGVFGRLTGFPRPNSFRGFSRAALGHLIVGKRQCHEGSQFPPFAQNA